MKEKNCSRSVKMFSFAQIEVISTIKNFRVFFYIRRKEPSKINSCFK